MSYGTDRPEPTPAEELIEQLRAAAEDDLEGLEEEDEAALDALLDRLRVIGDSVDPVHPLIDDLAYAAFETRDLDAELASLTADSAMDSAELVRGAGVAVPRMVSFEAESVTVELQVDRAGETAQIRGFVVGAERITLETPTGLRPVALDEHGWFVVREVPAGAVRLRIERADGGHVTTEWIAV